MKKSILILQILVLSVYLFSCTSKRIQQQNRINESISKTNAGKPNQPIKTNKTTTFSIFDTANLPAFTTVRMQGWRIQLKPTNDRNKAMSARTILITHFNEHKNYMLYHAPFYKIRLGNFKSSAAATAVMKKLRTYFSNEALFVIQDSIEYRMPKTEYIQWQIKKIQGG
jgi:hypothetical protein